jgi:hypothetical protein
MQIRFVELATSPTRAPVRCCKPTACEFDQSGSAKLLQRPIDVNGN